ncbi:hypothetical protein FRB99_006518 [Tulasnella sp. 403]|nr:hypothetical protein FRB99_006518 [Tulasnella sp. 403]
MDPLHPPVRTPAVSNSRSSYVSSPLNPNASTSNGRSRPPSWAPSAALLSDRAGGSSGSEGSVGNGVNPANERETIKGILSGAVGGGYGPYSPLRSSLTQQGNPHHRISTLSSVGSVISLPTDSKYPSMYVPNSNTQLSGGFFPYSDSPHIDYGGPGLTPEEDDALHDPNPRNKKDRIAPLNWRGVMNLLFVFIIIAALVALFAGYPIVSYFSTGAAWTGLAIGVNATGQAAYIPNLPQVIDPQTPESAKTHTGSDGSDYELVFSDEFNVDGRTFYPGDDPFWEAVDIWYGATMDLEWYDPQMITTRNGSLVITLEQAVNHGVNYRSGMLQSWNKFCFTGGYIEVSVLFPGDQNAMGFWPAAWTMGNLGRPGYGAATDGTWPYNYDSCDVGTLPNQTLNGQPELALTTGNSKSNGALSWLPGQRLSACTCPGEDHPGPTTSTGRNAPEIDIFEAEKTKIPTGGPGGQTSQSSQYAPFAASYQYDNTSTNVYSPDRTFMNTFKGSATQQSISALTNMDPSWFQTAPNPTYATFGLEINPSPGNRAAGSINWWSGGQPSWGLHASAVGPDATVGIGQRMISEEPMALVLNLGISESFQPVDVTTLHLPAELKFDYIRVYQKKGQVNVGCDPDSHPTAKYIQDHINAYTNANLSSWAMAGYTFPKNSLTGC